MIVIPASNKREPRCHRCAKPGPARVFALMMVEAVTKLSAVFDKPQMRRAQVFIELTPHEVAHPPFGAQTFFFCDECLNKATTAGRTITAEMAQKKIAQKGGGV